MIWAVVALGRMRQEDLEASLGCKKKKKKKKRGVGLK
jgi:hypothetical protein